ncbi:MAG: reverse transcriptase domain-containing protein, partial [Oscillospiraceae bacterium]
NNSNSEFLLILNGVPQGSILGPLLFLVYFNDIVDDISCIISLFADDVSLLNIMETWEDVQLGLNEDLTRLEKWSNKWFLTFSPIKTVYMMYSNIPKSISNLKLHLLLYNQEICRVQEHRHLGLILYESLNWSNHVDGLCKKVSKKLGFFYKMKSYFSRNVLVKLYKSMIMPLFDYGSVIYDNMSLFDVNKLERLQRRAAIICTGAQPRTETMKLLNDLGWQPLHVRRKKLKMLYLYKIHILATPLYLKDVVGQLYGDRIPRNTRYNQGSKIPFFRCRTTKFKKSFFPSSISEWNDLNCEFDVLESLSKFRKYLNIKFEYDNRFIDYNMITGTGTKIVTQMRLGLSDLKGQLFSYNLEENPFCTHCLTEIESVAHFFLKCGKYVEERKVFLYKLSLFIPNIDQYCNNDLIHICLNGDYNLDFDSNVNIIINTAKFVCCSNRFVF